MPLRKASFSKTNCALYPKNSWEQCLATEKPMKLTESSLSSSPSSQRMMAPSQSVPSFHYLEGIDHLGVFAGEIRFSDHVCRINGIQGPSRKLWLDLSQVTGALYQMKIKLNEDVILQ
jgi:hypothetical protein